MVAGAHGGAGVTTLAALLQPAWDLGAPRHTGREFPPLRSGGRPVVLVARNTSPLWAPVFPAAAAVVLDEGGFFQHAMLTCREYGVPVVFQTKDASQKLAEGQRVTVGGTNGWVLPGQ